MEGWDQQGARDTLCASAQRSPSLLPGGLGMCVAKPTRWEPPQIPGQARPWTGDQVHSRYLDLAGQPGPPENQALYCVLAADSQTPRRPGKSDSLLEAPGAQVPLTASTSLTAATSLELRAYGAEHQRAYLSSVAAVPIEQLLPTEYQLRGVLIPMHPVSRAPEFSLSPLGLGGWREGSTPPPP